MKKPLTIIISLIALIAVVYFVLEYKKEREIHKNIESKIELNKAQTAEMPQANSADFVELTRFKDTQGIWQVGTGAAPANSTEIQKVGVLHKTPVKGDVETPVYFCSFDVEGKSSKFISVDQKCPAGKPEGSEVVGYLSKLIRTGYFLTVNCRTKKHGVYPSLNARCEDSDDKFFSMLGAVRASNIQ